MNQISKRILSLLLAFILVMGLMPNAAMFASAATVDYKYGSTDQYSNIIMNWGVRGELATFLSPKAEDFYSGTSYAELAALSGSSSLTSVSSSALYKELNELMKDAHKKINSYEESKEMFQYTDCQKNGTLDSGKISTFYSGTLAGPAWDAGATFTREHVWPDSKGGEADTAAGTRDNETDIMMLRPIPQSENSSRSNTPYGENGVSGYYYPNKGEYDVRGDAARIILYTYVRWGTEKQDVLDNIWGKEGVIQSKDVLLDWMEADPVDTWEMGRNDSVQSITGTRNVFVDYPELAFCLFNEEVPTMNTPSGNAGTSSYSITAVSNNTAYGTVSVNGNSITAYPATGYYVSGYQVTSGSATVIKSGNVFTVTPSSDCTIRINFAKSTQYSVKFYQDGVAVSTQSVYSGSSITLPGFTGTLPTGYNFVGWVTSPAENVAAKPATVQNAGDIYAPAANTSFYALLSFVDGDSSTGTTYKLVTDSTKLYSGASVVIVAAGYDMAMSTTQQSNNRTAVAVTKSGDTLIFADGDGVQVLTLATGTVSGSYGFNTGSGYLYAYNATNNYLRTKSTLDDAGSFYITVNSDKTVTITSAKFTSSKEGVGNVPMQYNSSSSLFACYPMATQKALALYVAETGGTVTYTTVWTEKPAVCTHENCTTEDVSPTCTEQGYTTYTCIDCAYSYVEDYEDALGHTVVTVPGYAATLQTDGLTDGSYCSVCNEVFAEQTVIPCLAKVDSWGITLGDDLSVRFKIYIAPSIAQTATVHITVANKSYTYTAKNMTAAGDNCYLATIHMAAVQMADAITVKIQNGADSSKAMSYTVLQYATELLNDPTQSRYHQLLKEMLNYGGEAQSYFGYNKNNLVNTEITGAGAANIPTAHLTPMTYTGSLENAAYYGASLVHRNYIAVRFYFTGDVTGVTFTAAGKTYTPFTKYGMSYVEVDGILPQNLDQPITLTATDASGNVFTATYSPLNYIVRVGGINGDSSAAPLLKALYNYYLAAKALV